MVEGNQMEGEEEEEEGMVEDNPEEGEEENQEEGWEVDTGKQTMQHQQSGHTQLLHLLSPLGKKEQHN